MKIINNPKKWNLIIKVKENLSASLISVKSEILAKYDSDWQNKP